MCLDEVVDVCLIDLFGIGYLFDCCLVGFFGGEKSCVVIGCVFFFVFVFFIMDELFFVFDLVCKVEILLYFEYICDEIGILIFYVSYVMEEVVCFVNCVVLVVVGCVVV